MQPTMLSLATALRSLLTEDTWMKGAYFQRVQGNLCMCVHGGGQTLTNPMVKQAIDEQRTIAASRYVDEANASADANAAERAVKFESAQLVAAECDATVAAVIADEGETANNVDTVTNELIYSTGNVVVAADEGEHAVSSEVRDGVLGSVLCGARDVKKSSARINVWNRRPEYVKADGCRGKTEFHYLMGMFGLTASFNDEPTTTLAMVHERIDEMIGFCTEHNI